MRIAAHHFQSWCDLLIFPHLLFLNKGEQPVYTHLVVTGSQVIE